MLLAQAMKNHLVRLVLAAYIIGYVFRYDIHIMFAIDSILAVNYIRTVVRNMIYWGSQERSLIQTTICFILEMSTLTSI
jgi:hypothetical protein